MKKAKTSQTGWYSSEETWKGTNNWNEMHHIAYMRDQKFSSQIWTKLKYSDHIFLSKASSGHYVIRKSEQGKLCGLRFFTFFFLSSNLNFVTFPFFQQKFLSGRDSTRCPAAKGPGWRTTLRKKRFSSIPHYIPVNPDNDYDLPTKLLCHPLNHLFAVSFGDAWL